MLNQWFAKKRKNLVLKVFLLMVGMMISGYAGNAPFQIRYNPQNFYYFTIYSLVDNLIIYDVKINNGHTKLHYDTKYLTFPIKVDNKLKRWGVNLGFDTADKAIAISVSTNKGDWTFSTINTTDPMKLQYHSFNYMVLTAYKDMTIKRIIYNGQCKGQLMPDGIGRSLPYRIYMGKVVRILPDRWNKKCDQKIITVDIETDIGSWRYSF